MKKEGVFQSLLWLVVTAVGVLLCACHGRGDMSGRVIVQNSTFTLTADSIVEDTLIAWVQGTHDRINSNLTLARLDSLYGHLSATPIKFVHGKPWHRRAKRPLVIPAYTSGQPLVDALYDMSVEKITEGTMSSGQFNATGNLSRLYCAIYLSLAALKPHQAMSTLRTLVDRDSLIMQREGQWPVVSDHIGWATAAWEVYMVTGDRDWLDYSYHVIDKTLAINRQVLYDQSTGLMHGAGYTSGRPLGARRMTWMSYNDLFSCMSLGNNILTTHAYWVLDQMAEELGIDEVSYQKDAMRMKDAINQHLWNEQHGFYSSFLYGMAFPRQAPLTDNTSQAMCVLWNIADDDRAENLIAQTPVHDCGVNVTYPAPTAIEPYFTNASWATTQALWNMAAAAVGNESALRYGLGALYRAQALYQSRNIHIEGIDTDNLGTAAANAAMVLRLMMGLSFKAEGIEFAPFVPMGMPGTKQLTGLNYRKAVLDITVEGEGDDIAAITLDGKPMDSPFLPNDIEGHHSIHITMRHSGSTDNHVTVHHGEITLPPTPEVTWSADSGHIIQYNPTLPYRLWHNGHLTALDDSVFALPAIDGYAEYAVEVAGNYVSGYMSRPHVASGLTPQVAFLSTDSAHTALTVNVAEGGDYLLDMGYYPTGSLDVRQASANGHLMGTIVMAAGNAPRDSIVYCNMVNMKLLKGQNTITIQQIRLPKSFTACKPVFVRIFKR